MQQQRRVPDAVGRLPKVIAMKTAVFSLFAAGVILAFGIATGASAHDATQPSGASKLVGFGHCAKGPCVRRSTFGMDAIRSTPASYQTVIIRPGEAHAARLAAARLRR